MKKIIVVILFVILSIQPSTIFSFSLNTIDVALQLFIPDNGALFLSDIDLTNIKNAPVLFGITINNNYSEPVEIQLEIGVRRNQQDIIKGMTYPFIIPPGMTYLTNRDLGMNPDFSYTDINLGELEEIVYATGKLPEGQYQFFVRVFQGQSSQDEDIKFLTISNPPTVLDLLSPGQQAEGIEMMEIYTTLPFFLWHSNAVRYRITICELMPSNSSPADVMNNEPRMQATIDMLTFFPYPSSGVRTLQPGRTYYWQVVAITESSDGPVELESEIWGFKISNLIGGAFSMEHQQLLAYLTSFFGGRGLADLFEPGGELDGFTFTGAMFNNGAPMTYEDLNSFIEQIIDNRITIGEHFVE